MNDFVDIFVFTSLKCTVKFILNAQVVLVAGTVNIRGGCEAHALDQTNRTVDLERGVLYHLFNGGHLVARYQLIETLPTAPSS